MVEPEEWHLKFFRALTCIRVHEHANTHMHATNILLILYVLRVRFLLSTHHSVLCLMNMAVIPVVSGIVENQFSVMEFFT